MDIAIGIFVAGAMAITLAASVLTNVKLWGLIGGLDGPSASCRRTSDAVS